MSHVSLEWGIPRFRRFYEALAGHFRVLRFDPRGSGMSDNSEITQTTWQRDVAAVLQAVTAQRVSIVSCGNGSVISVPLVAHFSGSIAAFVALAPGLNPATPMAAVQETLHRLTPENEGQMLARAMDPDGRDPPGPLANLFEQAMTGAARRQWETLLPNVDMTGALADVQAPSLVVHYPEEPLYPSGPAMAAAIEGARLVVRPGRGYPLYDPDPDSLIDLIRDFLLEHADQPSPTTIAKAPAAGTIPLSPREIEVLRLLAAGSTNAEIAEVLVIAPGTVARHVSNMLAKTGLSNRVELATYAADHGLRQKDA